MNPDAVGRGVVAVNIIYMQDIPEISRIRRRIKGWVIGERGILPVGDKRRQDAVVSADILPPAIYPVRLKVNIGRLRPSDLNLLIIIRLRYNRIQVYSFRR